MAVEQPPNLKPLDPGAALREFLILSYSTQKVVTAAFVAQLCCLIVDNGGGNGIHDLAYKTTRSASEHLKLIMAREFGDPNLDYVETPVYLTKSASRSSVSMPVQLPSKIFQRELEGHVEPAATVEPQSSFANFDCEVWESNPLRQSTSLHWSRVIPVSLYLDGVQYGVRESFHGLYIRNLRSGVQHLMSIIRADLSSR